jgi:protein TonB
VIDTLARRKQPPVLAWALGVSLVLHALLLTVHFTVPDLLPKATERALDVVLVNSKSRHKPQKAQARAQTSLDGGGTLVEDVRAKTPLPPSLQTKPGNDVIQAQQRAAALESEVHQLLTQVAGRHKTAPSLNAKQSALQTDPVLSGVDLANRALAVARIEGEIAQRMEAYNQRPRKKFIGARVEEYRFAQYVEDWRQKVERVGNLNYPSAARGRLYGNLVLTAVIKSDGSLDRVEVSRSSGQQVLDQAAARIVKLAAPYAAFPESIRRDTDVIEITRTWTFTRQNALHGE